MKAKTGRPPLRATTMTLRVTVNRSGGIDEMNSKPSFNRDQAEMDLLRSREAVTRGFIVTTPGGRRDGIDYDAIGIEYVRLDSADFAYRISTPAEDEDWRLGVAEDVLDAAENLEAR